jgi:uncharacterized protein (TIGR00299 family) protein
MKILYFDCFSGVSGDMTLAALLDLGLPLEKLREELKKLGLGNYSLEVRPGSRSGIAALGLEVQVGPREEPHRHFSHIREMILKSVLDPEVKEISLTIFQRLAEAEAGVHKKAVEEIHFHEVGAVDSIVDIVGTAIGIHYFKPGRIYTSELPMGWGFVQCQHGRLPLPAPATVEVLKGYPVKSVNVEGELVTPTGAAIVAALSSKVSPFPSMVVEKIGYGMGKKEFPDRPNLLRLVLGEASEGYLTDRAVILESNIDDMNPEFYDYLMERLFQKGALDVALSPLQMKKNRPGTLLRVIAEEKDREALSELILRESTTLGVRSFSVDRKKLPRKVREVETRYGKIRVKVSGEAHFQPEYEDCRRVAREKGVPIQDVYWEAMTQGKSQKP